MEAGVEKIPVYASIKSFLLKWLRNFHSEDKDSTYMQATVSNGEIN